MLFIELTCKVAKGEHKGELLKSHINMAKVKNFYRDGDLTALHFHLGDSFYAKETEEEIKKKIKEAQNDNI